MKPFKTQEEFIKSSKPVVIWPCKRAAGSTTAVCFKAVRDAFNSKRVLILTSYSTKDTLDQIINIISEEIVLDFVEHRSQSKVSLRYNGNIVSEIKVESFCENGLIRNRGCRYQSIIFDKHTLESVPELGSEFLLSADPVEFQQACVVDYDSKPYRNPIYSEGDQIGWNGSWDFNLVEWKDGQTKTDFNQYNNEVEVIDSMSFWIPEWLSK